MPIDVNAITTYCQKYSIPEEHFLEILEDFKVLPMLRGKGFEYYVFDRLKDLLDPSAWEVAKYNTNPQQNTTDSDLVVKNIEHDVAVIIETKTASRGSFKSGYRARKCRVPHYTVKCHKSRSNISRTLTNDRYFADEFDIVFSNPANAFIDKGDFKIIDSEEVKNFLVAHCGSAEPDVALPKLSSDIVFALTTDLATTDGTIPRTPIVMFHGDPRWHAPALIEKALSVIVERKLAAATRRPTKPAYLTFDK